MNEILSHDIISNQIKQFIQQFSGNQKQIDKKGLFVFGDSGVGKTTLVMNTLNALGNKVLYYDASCIRNKAAIEALALPETNHDSIMDIFNGIKRQTVIVMDEIDGMNGGDRGGIKALIKLIRHKKTKKELLLNKPDVLIPIICIGNYNIDKKMKELMKVCDKIEMKKPNKEQIKALLSLLPNVPNVPNLGTVAHDCTTPNSCTTVIQACAITDEMVDFVQGDLCRIIFLNKFIHKDHGWFEKYKSLFLNKTNINDTNQLTKQLINQPVHIADHTNAIKELNRTTVGLLWHENIVDVLDSQPKQITLPLYHRILDDICFADNIDRITFQNQIWQFKEMSSLLKTFKPNQMVHQFWKELKTPKGGKVAIRFNPQEIRFTKILTKYATEYNNLLFINNMCQQLNLNKNELFSYFMYLKQNREMAEIEQLFVHNGITNLNVARMYRFIHKMMTETEEEEICDDDLDD